MRRTLKMSGSKAVSDELGPTMSRKPIMTTTILTANKMKLTLSNAKFRLSIIFFTFLLSYFFTFLPFLDFVQLASGHLEVLVHRDIRTRGGEENAKGHNSHGGDDQFQPANDGLDVGLVII